MINDKKWSSVKEAFNYARKVFLGQKTKTEFKEAKEAMKYCAENNDTMAQYQMYALDYEAAQRSGEKPSLEWLIKAADADFKPAQYDLALHYLYGDGIEEDPYKAIVWMEKSAEDGYPDACKTLIRLFTVGTRIKKNEVRADYWKAKLEKNSYAETHILLDFTPDMAVPEPIIREKREIDPKVKVQEKTFDQIFKVIEQTDVIEADCQRSFIINAGPGTGKTYSMVRRINELLKQGIEPDEILVLSFANAVVKEVNDRLFELSNTNEGVYGLRSVEVRTFHSFAYHILKVANNQEELEGWTQVDLNLNKLTYDDCIIKGSQLVEDYDDIMGALGYKYFIVDEIQDINHGKAAFVLAILNSCILSDIPYLFMGDSCQAIYDYLDEKASKETKIISQKFYAELLTRTAGKADAVAFEVNHRSIKEEVQKTARIRQVILGASDTKYRDAVADYVDSLQSVSLNEVEKYVVEHPNERICIMERSNVDTTHLSNKLLERGIDHTCLLSEHKGLYPRWIGEIFGDFQEDYISREIVNNLFLSKGYSEEQTEMFWSKLQSNLNIPEEIIPMKSVLIVLQSHKMDTLFEQDEKRNGLVVSNIHRTKGLEYDRVFVDEAFLNSRNWEADEMRVLYVAITRAKKETLVMTDSENLGFMKAIGFYKRHFRKEKLSKTKYRHRYVEVITKEESSDFLPERFIVSNIEKSQEVISRIKPNDRITLNYNDENNAYAIVYDNTTIGWMAPQFTKDLNWLIRNDYPRKFEGLAVDNVYTYIGSVNDRIPWYEKELQNMDVKNSKYRIWNYVIISGMAHAIY